jgi:Family of unknown function (DUF6932)
MPLPNFDADGFLPTGIHAASLAEVGDRFGQGAPLRRREFDLLRRVVAAALECATIKRVLLWGSFVIGRPAPQDLDYSVVVALDHPRTAIGGAHRRFLVPSEARQRYGVDTGYLLIADYPLEIYVERVEFLCHTKSRRPCGIVEVALRGEVGAR